MFYGPVRSHDGWQEMCYLFPGAAAITFLVHFISITGVLVL